MATNLGSKAVGSIVKLKVGGTLTDFIVVHQGRPSTSLYDASCDGTWLLMKDCYEQKQWHKSYQRLHGEDVITTPKTKKSNRTIKMPNFLCEEMQDYLGMLYGIKKKRCSLRWKQTK